MPIVIFRKKAYFYCSILTFPSLNPDILVKFNLIFLLKIQQLAGRVCVLSLVKWAAHTTHHVHHLTKVRNTNKVSAAAHGLNIKLTSSVVFRGTETTYITTEQLGRKEPMQCRRPMTRLNFSSLYLDGQNWKKKMFLLCLNKCSL